MKTRQPTIADAINFDHALEFSYSGYHADAIDYLCLFRSTALTVKAYFFDHASEDQVIVPHTHRYDFDTRVIAGSLTEVRYAELFKGGTGGMPTSRYKYECIADGGIGFTFDEAARVLETSATHYGAGGTYSNRAHRDIHTLRKVRPGTILLLTQYADVFPSCTYAWSTTPPQCEDQYRKMERHEIARRIEQLQAAASEGSHG